MEFWTSALDVAVRALVSIFALFILTRLLGKKQISQLNVFDYVIGISIGNIAAEMSVNPEVSYIEGLVPMIIYTFISLLMSWLMMKSIYARRFVTGVPIIVIENGKIIEEGLKKIKFDINELLQECRASGYFDISQLEYGIMEANGRLSFLPKSKYVPLTPNDMKMKPAYKGLCANLIIDGEIMKDNLSRIGKDEKWLLKRLSNNGYEGPDNILLLICDTNEQFTIYEKNKGKAYYQVLE